VKQSVRHLLIIAGTLLLVFGLLFFSFALPMVKTDIYAVTAILLGMYILMRLLQNTHSVKVRKVNIVEAVEQREIEKKKEKMESSTDFSENS
jgi:predicted membrane protein